MRGVDVTQESLFSTRSTGDFVPPNHPLIGIAALVNKSLKAMDADFEAMYSSRGRASIPPERLLRGLLLQALFGVRSERLLCEQLGYNMLFRWFVGLGLHEAAWDHSTYTQNRDRFIVAGSVKVLFGKIIEEARRANLLSSEHFSVDGTLIQAWASTKSVQPKEGPPPDKSGSKSNPEVNFKGQKRSNETHRSVTDPEAKLYRKSSNAEAKPAFLGHAVIENRSGLVVAATVTQASGTAEREAALEMMDTLEGAHQKTLGADKNYDTVGFVKSCRDRGITPHVAQNHYEKETKTGKRVKRKSAIDKRTTRHAGYALSQRKRKQIETLWGDAKQHAGTIRQVKLRGVEKISQVFGIAMIVVNLRRLPKLLAKGAARAKEKMHQASGAAVQKLAEALIPEIRPTRSEVG